MSSSIEPDAKRRKLESQLTVSPAKCLECFIDQLPSSLFAYICGFLSLEFKLAHLPMLNKSIHEMFVPSTCYREHRMFIDIKKLVATEKFPHMDRRTHRDIIKSVYLKYASDTSARLCDFETFSETIRNSVINSVAECINNPHLIEFSLCESSSGEPFVLTRVFEALRQRTPEQLQKLKSLDIAHSRSRDKEPRTTPTMDWTGISNCQSLTSLRVNLHDFSTDHLEHILQCLPQSLNVINFWAMFDAPMINHNVIVKALKCSTFLPNLTTVHSLQHDELLEGFCTVMTETGQTRPLGCLNINITKIVDLSSFHALKTLQIHLQCQLMNVLCDLSDSAMPRLTHFKITITTEALHDACLVDISSIFIFASARPITRFEVRLHNVLDEEDATEFPFTSLSSSAITAWSTMKSLTHMSIDGTPAAFDCESIFEHVDIHNLPIGCWPDMVNISLDGCPLTPDHLRIALNATSNLKFLHLRSCPFKWLTHLSMIAQACPTITSISAHSVLQPQTLVELQESFNQNPFNATSFLHLTALLIYEDELEADVLHYLCSQLRVLPCLEHLSVSHDGTLFMTAIRVCGLPHLNQIAPNERDAAYVWDAKAVKDTNHSENEQPLFSDFFREDLEFYPNDWFRTLSDDPPVDGHAGYCDAILARLSDAERELLSRWDAGDYTSSPPITHVKLDPMSAAFE